jgi:hypothetical protein
MKTSVDPTISEILHRLVVPIQTRGNLGKSTEAIARCEWMTERHVTWRGYDLDAFNRTLSTTYPEGVVFVEPGSEPEGELIKIFRGLAQSEVTVIDPRAHMNRTILRAMEMVRLTQLAKLSPRASQFSSIQWMKSPTWMTSRKLSKRWEIPSIG